MALRNFNPDDLLQNWSDEKLSPTHSGKPFAQCIREAFRIPSSDSYVYRAQAETTLDFTQRAIAAKDANGMHDWYHDDERNPVGSMLLLCNIDEADRWEAGASTSINRRNHIVYIAV
jgi:hypothetical protein